MVLNLNCKRIEFNELVWRKFSDYSPIPCHNHPIVGMDTETYKGYCRLICDSNGKYLLCSDIDSILQFITSRQYENKHIFFYNMHFDVEAILKYLPKDVLYELYERNKAEYELYTIVYIPRKMFRIQHGKHSIRCYDLEQFYNTSLDTAANTYLGVGKMVTPFDRDAINTDWRIWEDYRETLINYCMQDAILTQKLGVILQENIKRYMKFNPKDYISKASLSKRYFRLYCDIPDVKKIPREILRTAFYAYKGGRFELIRKGYFPYAELYDIKSAYPYEIANLIDITRGKWKAVKEYNPDAYYGFYIVNLSLKYRHIEPIAYVRRDNLLIYPGGEWKSIISKSEIELLEDDKEYKIIRGYEFYPEEIVYPFKNKIEELYSVKCSQPKNSYLYSLSKIIMNALYGCFYEKVKKEDGIHTGKLFNPVYATIITANTRAKIYQFGAQYEDDVIAFATDSVLIKEKHKIKEGKQLGDWEKQGDGECVAFQSGIYKMQNEVKSRGIQKKTEISTPEGKFKDIFEYIQAYPNRTQYEITIRRPLHIKESLIHHKIHSVTD
ncbi:MAG: hypothetical protein DRP09_17310, partial [Candidatus Thorarchaeota archaeon]